jgi:SAM-dependent methyltransferase
MIAEMRAMRANPHFLDHRKSFLFDFAPSRGEGAIAVGARRAKLIRMSDEHEHRHHGHHHHSHHGHDREGARQPERFDPARAALLDDPRRFDYLPPDKIIEMLDTPQSGVVIDFGAGTGAYSIEIARRRPDVTVVAFDEQPRMLEMLRAKPAAAELGNLKPVLATDASSLTASADRILALNVLHELGDDALRGLGAMLKPGGRALFIDWSAEVDRPIGPPKDHVYTRAEAVKRLEQFGFAKVSESGLPYHYVVIARRADG